MGSMYESLLDAEQIANYFPHVFTELESKSSRVRPSLPGQSVEMLTLQLKLLREKKALLSFKVPPVEFSHGGGIFVVFIEKHFRNHGQKFLVNS
jgi:hypothetical protein